MKRSKFRVPIIAVVLAFTTVFATKIDNSLETEFQWHKYSGPASNPVVTTVTASEEAAQIECPGSQDKCMVKLDGAGQETTDIYSRN